MLILTVFATLVALLVPDEMLSTQHGGSGSDACAPTTQLATASQPTQPPAQTPAPSLPLPLLAKSIRLGTPLTEVQSALPWLTRTPEGLAFESAETECRPVPYDVEVRAAAGVVVAVSLDGADGECDNFERAWKSLEAQLRRELGKPKGACRYPRDMKETVCVWAKGTVRVTRTLSMFNEDMYSRTYEIKR